MHNFYNIKKLFFILSLLVILSSCKDEFKSSNYEAYFGGEIVNPNNPYVLFCKDNEVIDTFKLDKNNRFFVFFDSLAPGMYTFKHEPEYQYVYFDKNDSIMVRVNSKDFDHSLAFCGRGDKKNNFLIEQFLRNEKDKNSMFNVFDYDVNRFSKVIDSSYAKAQKIYTSKKKDIKWSDDFDQYAKASVDYNHFIKKELYPIVHKIKTGQDVCEKLPKDFYDYRKNIDYNNTGLSSYSPFVMYLSHMLNNMGAINYHNHYTEADLALKTNINKMTIADTLIKDVKIKNIILNNIAFTYLLEDQNMVNNKKFFDTYYKYSTDKSKKNEILQIGKAIQQLKVGNPLPNVTLENLNGQLINSSDITNKKAVIFFWTSCALNHFKAVHQKVSELSKKHSDYQFIAININDSDESWKKTLSNYQTNGVIQLRCSNFENLKDKWVITKIHRAMILDNKGLIKNAFTNIFVMDFEDLLIE